MQKMAQSYGLDIHDDDDLYEAKEIMKGLRNIDEQQGKKRDG